MYLKQITPPQTEPVTLSEAKAHLRIDGSEEDELLSALITTAREMAEDYTRRSLVLQEWELGIDKIDNRIYLPKSPVQSIDYVAVDGEPIPLDNYYLVGADTFYTKIPLCATMPDGVVIRYKAGFDTNQVPEKIKHAIKMLVGYLYENREGQASGGLGLPPTVMVVLRPYRTVML